MEGVSLQDRSFRVGDVWALRISRPKGYKHMIQKGRRSHGFIYVASGQIRDVFPSGDEESWYVNAGELVFMPKGTVYTGIYQKENTEIKMVQFDLLCGELPSYLSKPVKITLPDAAQLIEAFFEPMGKRMANASFYYLSCLYALLWRLEENESKIPAKYKKLRGALCEMREHWNENPPVSYYADLCDMSQVHFRRLFKEYTGRSPVDYRNGLRLEEARNKLQSGEYNVSEVAELCGFSSISFFTKTYKKKYGHSPKNE